MTTSPGLLEICTDAHGGPVSLQPRPDFVAPVTYLPGGVPLLAVCTMNASCFDGSWAHADWSLTHLLLTSRCPNLHVQPWMMLNDLFARLRALEDLSTELERELGKIIRRTRSQY